MAIEFPPNPAIGDTVTGPYGEVYTFNGIAWSLTTGSSGGGGITNPAELISNEAGNALVLGDDSLLYVPAGELPAVSFPAAAVPIPPRLTGSAIMAGLGIAFTPQQSTRVLIILSGSIATDDGDVYPGQTGNCYLNVGTGIPPSPGDPESGTRLTNSVQWSIGNTSGGLQMPCPLSGIAIDLTIGTEYWIDVSIGSGSGASNFFNANNATVMELPDAGFSGGDFLPLTGGTLTGTLSVNPSAAASQPGQLTVGGRGINYAALGAVGANIAWAFSSNQIYMYVNGIAWGPLVTLNVGNTTYVRLTGGGNVIGDLMVAGRESVLPPSGGVISWPANAVPGTFLGYRVSSSGLFIGCYCIDAANNTLASLPGWGIGGLGVGSCTIGSSDAGIALAWAPPVADGAPITLTDVATFTPNGATFPGPTAINNTTGAAGLVINAANSNVDAQIALAVPGLETWLLGSQNGTSQFYVFDQTQNAYRITITPTGDIYFGGTTHAVWALPSGGDNTGYCGSPGGAWAAVCSYDFAQQSDPRGKRDMAPAAPGALEKVNALEVITYRNVPPEKRSGDGPDYDRVRTGFDASEVAKVHPGAATDSGYSLADMNALLWQAVQELTQKVAALEAKIAAA